MSVLERPAAPTGARAGEEPRADVVLVLCAVTLAAVGALLVYSATRNDAALTGGDPAALLRRHVLSTLVGLGLGALVVRVGWRTLRSLAPLAYGAAVLGLLVVLSPLGDTVNGARSWISLPAGFSLQPSELAKVALVLVLAVLLGGERWRAGTRVWLALGAVGLPVALVLLQPDLGTVLVLAATAGAVLVVAGLRVRWLLAHVAAAAAVVALAIRAGVLRDYQLARFAVFADPGVDPLGVGYNTAQARLAISSGGLTGTGLFAGPRTGGSYVPEQQTDFIFTVAGEELGFVGSSMIIVLFGVLLWRVLRIGARSPDLEGRLVAAGVAGWFGFQVFQSIGMTLGIMPVTGLPLPFVSYGGSSMFAGMLAIGLLQAVARRPVRSFG